MLKIEVKPERTNVYIEGTTKDIIQDTLSGIGSVYGAIRKDPDTAGLFVYMLQCAVNDAEFWAAAVEDAEDADKEEVKG